MKLLPAGMGCSHWRCCKGNGHSWNEPGQSVEWIEAGLVIGKFYISIDIFKVVVCTGRKKSVIVIKQTIRAALAENGEGLDDSG